MLQLTITIQLNIDTIVSDLIIDQNSKQDNKYIFKVDHSLLEVTSLSKIETLC